MTKQISRRLAAFAGVGALAAIAVLGAANPALASQPVDGDHKIVFCHATHSEKNPYVIIETDKIAVVSAHFKHQDLEDAWAGFWYDDHGVETWMPGHSVDAAPQECGGGIG